MLGHSIKWILRAIIFAGLCVGLANCTMLGLNYSSLEIENKPAPTPELTARFDTAATRATLEAELYGPWPANLPVSASQPRMIDANYLGGTGTLEEIMFTIGTGDTARTFPVVLALPNRAETKPVPLIISLSFADNCSVFPNDRVSNGQGGICEGSNFVGWRGYIATQIFGTYIAEAPIERYFKAGLGYASTDGSGFVPDKNGSAQDVMAALQPGPQPTSALMSWAFGFQGIAEVLGEDQRIDQTSIAALGHSRFGKAALVAAAWSDNIDAAIAHQSGFAGGSSSRSKTGETLQRMASSYPHWVRPGLGADMKAGKELTLDQHFLLALAAPKPIFLGNGRRDVWSDPNSSFRLAQAADAVYEQRGSEGLTASGMKDFKTGDDIAYWLRDGGHSVVSEDIDAFIDFMTAHFGAPLPSGNTLQSGQ